MVRGSLPDAPDQEHRGRKGQRGDQEYFEEHHGTLPVMRFLLLSISLLRNQDAKWDRKTALTGHSCLNHGMRELIPWPRRAVRRGELPGRKNENGNDVDSFVYSVDRCPEPLTRCSG